MTLEQEAANQNTSPNRLRELATLNPELARLVANNSNADSELLRDLIATSDYITRQNVATNPNTPQEVLIKLAWQFPQEVLNNHVFEQIISENSNLLKRFSKKVLLRLIQQDKIPVSFLEWVADCSDKKVLLTLLINPNITVSALEKLCHQEPEVVDAVKLHVNWRQELDNIDEVLSKAIAITNLERNWDDEYKLLKLRVIPDFILPDFDDFTRLIIAEEPHTSAKVLTQLIRDSDKHREPEIKIAVAQHPNTPKNLLENFLGDDRFRYAAANNPNTPLNVVQQFYHQHNAVSNPDTPSEILSQFVSSRWQTIRLGVARHQNTPTNILEQFAVVDSLQLRLAVAFNLSTPIHVFEQLIKDNYWEVRWAVAQNLSTPAHILEQLVAVSLFFYTHKLLLRY